ncbi:hypothetical protein [Halothiobacillus sp.]|uniref:hypothetical protein n=1 Tax=Halothiobacillus sp. TaxID=1891311 RepID=UPI002AD57E1E|nr:hypothetical protein [Halothiobacillus sp.]
MHWPIEIETMVMAGHAAGSAFMSPRGGDILVMGQVIRRDPYYYPPQVITVPSSPPVYIQQDEPPVASAPQNNYWYYCRNPQGYYPYVKQCPGGWQAVAPQPPETMDGR